MSLNFNKVEELTDMIVSTTSSLRRHLKSMFMTRRDLTLFSKTPLLIHYYKKHQKYVYQWLLSFGNRLIRIGERNNCLIILSTYLL